jgi:hypothetical protein
MRLQQSLLLKITIIVSGSLFDIILKKWVVIKSCC